MHGARERLGRSDRIRVLPEEVAGVEIHAGDRTDGVAKPQQRRHVVGEVQRMQLERETPDAVLGCERSSRAPELDHGFPLALA